MILTIYQSRSSLIYIFVQNNLILYFIFLHLPFYKRVYFHFSLHSLSPYHSFIIGIIDSFNELNNISFLKIISNYLISLGILCKYKKFNYSYVFMSYLCSLLHIYVGLNDNLQLTSDAKSLDRAGILDSCLNVVLSNFKDSSGKS